MPRLDFYLPPSFCQIIAKQTLAFRTNGHHTWRGRRLTATVATPHVAFNLPRLIILPLIRGAIKRKGRKQMLIRLDVWQIKMGGPAMAQPRLKCQQLVISHQQSPEMVHQHTRYTLTHTRNPYSVDFHTPLKVALMSAHK